MYRDIILRKTRDANFADDHYQKCLATDKDEIWAYYYNRETNTRIEKYTFTVNKTGVSVRDTCESRGRAHRWGYNDYTTHYPIKEEDK